MINKTYYVPTGCCTLGIINEILSDIDFEWPISFSAICLFISTLKFVLFANRQQIWVSSRMSYKLQGFKLKKKKSDTKLNDRKTLKNTSKCTKHKIYTATAVIGNVIYKLLWKGNGYF